MDLFGIFNELLSTQNVNVARNVECDFFVTFKHRADMLTSFSVAVFVMK